MKVANGICKKLNSKIVITFMRDDMHFDIFISSLYADVEKYKDEVDIPLFGDSLSWILPFRHLTNFLATKKILKSYFSIITYFRYCYFTNKKEHANDNLPKTLLYILLNDKMNHLTIVFIKGLCFYFVVVWFWFQKLTHILLLHIRWQIQKAIVWVSHQ